MSEPLTLTAGDTWSWTRPGGSYPASAGWVLTYYFSIPGTATVKALEAAASGDDFAVSQTAAQSADWTAGLFAWTARVAKAGETHTLDQGQLRVLPDPATTAAAASHAQKCLVIIESALEKCLGDAVVEYELDGVKFKKNRTELLSLRTFYREEVHQERAAKAGKSGLRIIKVALR